MIILSCIPFIFTGFSYVFAVFILLFLFALIYKIMRV